MLFRCLKPISFRGLRSQYLKIIFSLFWLICSPIGTGGLRNELGFTTEVNPGVQSWSLESEGFKKEPCLPQLGQYLSWGHKVKKRPFPNLGWFVLPWDALHGSKQWTWGDQSKKMISQGPKMTFFQSWLIRAPICFRGLKSEPEVTNSKPEVTRAKISLSQFWF